MTEEEGQWRTKVAGVGATGRLVKAFQLGNVGKA